MTDSTSKKPYDASSRSTKPHSPVFFLDRCLGRHTVANALRAAGQTVELHGDHFEQDAEDKVWVPAVGARGWLILTKDRHIKTNQIEIASLIQANTYCFNLVSASLTGTQMATALCNAINDIHQLVSRMQPPLVVNVSSSGVIKILYQYSDLVSKLDRPPTHHSP